MKIDPVEVMVAALATIPDLVDKTGGRIAGRTLFGSGWEPGQTALVTTLAGGTPSPLRATWGGQFTLRCYGQDYPEAMDVQRAAAEALQALKRSKIAVQGGDSLVYYIEAASAPSQQWDPDLKLPLIHQVVRALFSAEVYS